MTTTASVAPVTDIRLTARGRRIMSPEETRALAFDLLKAADDVEILRGTLDVPTPTEPQPIEDDEESLDYRECSVDPERGVCVTNGMVSGSKEWTVDTDTFVFRTGDEVRAHIVYLARAARILSEQTKGQVTV